MSKQIAMDIEYGNALGKRYEHMQIEDLSQYERIVVWGCGQNFKNLYKKQFYVDYIVDNDSTKRGERCLGISIVDSETCFKDIQDINAIIVIAAESFYGDIYKQIRGNNKKCDVIKLSELNYMYNIKNQSFALWGIDILVRDILIRGGYDIRDITYIEVGANHPVLGNATETLYINGARGVLIEANPDFKDVIERFRDDICINCGVASLNGKMKFYRFENSYRNSFDLVEVKKNIARGYAIKDEIEVEVVTLSDILDKYSVNTAKAFLSLQVMGLEKELLKAFDYKKYDFPIISIAYYDEKIFEYDIFRDYYEIARVPRHVVLVNKEIYNKIIN